MSSRRPPLAAFSSEVWAAAAICFHQSFCLFLATLADLLLRLLPLKCLMYFLDEDLYISLEHKAEIPPYCSPRVFFYRYYNSFYCLHMHST